ncbi:MAG: DUF2628 domain-containing protein [Clostridia bacterium]|nr:DUF2628 domain-containing protein [Clostridia bacterium]
MFFNEKKCDGCAEIMHEGEDIVVCPECGTPQHRECYNKNNACVNAHLHAEGFDWREANITPEEPKPAEPAVNSVPVFDAANGIPEINLPIFNAESIVIDNKVVSTNTEVSGIKVKDALTYIQVNANRYIKKFIRHENKKTFLSWNWGAFFFTPAWFFYRKLYKAGAFFLTFAVAATLVVLPYTNIIAEATETLNPLMETVYVTLLAFFKDMNDTTANAFMAASEAYMTAFRPILPYVLAVDALTFVLPCTASAVMANTLYRNKMLDDIRIAKKATSDPNIQRYSMLRRGGVSIFAGLAALMAESYLPSIIMSVIKNFI